MAPPTSASTGLSPTTSGRRTTTAPGLRHSPATFVRRGRSRRRSSTTHDTSHLDHPASDPHAPSCRRRRNRLLGTAHDGDGVGPPRRAQRPRTTPATGSPTAPSATPCILALNLLPFAGIAFLWFIGVVRDRIGEGEDRFFATVFLGSGLLFIAMLFATGAIAGGLVLSAEDHLTPGVWSFGRRVTHTLLTVYSMRMAAVFAISTTTIAARLGLAPRWLTILGLATGTVLLLSAGVRPLDRGRLPRLGVRVQPAHPHRLVPPSSAQHRQRAGRLTPRAKAFRAAGPDGVRPPRWGEDHGRPDHLIGELKSSRA